MTWKLSRFRAGDRVEVRSKEEILATLDASGCIAGMPFMPEMLQYCGRRLTVGAVAHKTCDVAHRTFQSRKLDAMVHLAGARCDGSGHGGCQAECNLFWSDAWLKPAGGDLRPAPPHKATGITETVLVQLTRRPSRPDEPAPVYSCQATRVFDATRPMHWWDPRQYMRDVTTRNHSASHVVRVLFVAFLKHVHEHVPRGYKLTRALYTSVHRRVFGRDLPDYRGRIALDRPTPTGKLGLKPGERVRVKSKADIEATLDVKGRNRGLAFDVELSPFCGTVGTVHALVTRLIDEATGRMLEMKQPCVIVEGVTCRAEYSDCRLLCPRAIPSYWREIWLERTNPAPGAADSAG